MDGSEKCLGSSTHRQTNVAQVNVKLNPIAKKTRKKREKHNFFVYFVCISFAFTLSTWQISSGKYSNLRNRTITTHTHRMSHRRNYERKWFIVCISIYHLLLVVDVSVWPIYLDCAKMASYESKWISSNVVNPNTTSHRIVQFFYWTNVQCEGGDGRRNKSKTVLASNIYTWFKSFSFVTNWLKSVDKISVYRRRVFNIKWKDYKIILAASTRLTTAVTILDDSCRKLCLLNIITNGLRQWFQFGAIITNK